MTATIAVAPPRTRLEAAFLAKDQRGYFIAEGRPDRDTLEAADQPEADDTTVTMSERPSLPLSDDRESGFPAVESAAQPRTAVVLLNWNGAQDSIECIRSLCRMTNQNFLIVLCDNHSDDGSFEFLKRWAERELPTLSATWHPGQAPPRLAKLILIQTGANLGFAGGCNVGLRYAMLHTHAEFIWLLNNDTIVDVLALDLQIVSMEQRQENGMLGSTVIYFNDRDRVQAPGGYDFNFWTARVLPLAKVLTPASLPPANEVERRLRYICGASMFIRRSFVEQVGLLNEQYFLYFEEVDWAIRAKGRFRLGYCPASMIWHKEGKAIGSHSKPSERSLFSESYLARNRILFLKTYFPGRLPIGLLWIFLVVAVRVFRGQWKLARTLGQGALRGLRTPILPIPALHEWPESMRQPSERPAAPAL